MMNTYLCFGRERQELRCLKFNQTELITIINSYITCCTL